MVKFTFFTKNISFGQIKQKSIENYESFKWGKTCAVKTVFTIFVLCWTIGYYEDINDWFLII